MTINERIKHIQVDSGLKAWEFGERIGIKKSSISTILSGKTNPSEQTIRSICREFGVQEAWLKTGKGEIYKASETLNLDDLINEYGMNTTERTIVRNLLRVYFSLQQDTRQEIMARFSDVFSGYLMQMSAQNLRKAIREELQRRDELKNVHDWTDAELQRQLDAEKEETDEPSTFFSGSSGTAIA